MLHGGNMKKKILVGTILSAVFIALLPISSVAGVHHQELNRDATSSPLFAARMQQQLDKPLIHIPNQDYLGQRNAPTIFLTKRSTLNGMLERSHRIINAEPRLFEAAIQRILSSPEAQQIMDDYDLDKSAVDQELQVLLNDPALLQEKMKGASQIISPLADDPIPLQLSTSSALGCFIIVLIMVPLLLTIALVIATVTIITCINLGGCLENLLNGLVEGFVQQLTPPDELI